jgi:mediator of replication checkpoint protein 1
VLDSIAKRAAQRDANLVRARLRPSTTNKSKLYSTLYYISTVLFLHTLFWKMDSEIMSPPLSPKNSSPSPSEQPTELTPRSKVRALLAQFDDSDSDSTPIQTVPALKPTSPEDDAKSSGSTSPVQSESDSDLEPVTKKPVGRMAARMQARNTEPTTKSISPQPQSAVSTPSKPRSSSLPKSSPGLFVSPTKDAQDSSVSDSEESDTLLNTTNAKLKELLARKRAERKADKAILRKQQKLREAQRLEKITSDAAELERVVNSESDGDDDAQVRQSLTKQSRPARKAGKKALEEMNRETQRMSREQNLTHQAKVKKTFRTSDFLKYFNSKTSKDDNTSFSKSSDDEATKMFGALASSDTEEPKTKDTPPTSPVVEDVMNFKVPPPVPTLAQLSNLSREVNNEPLSALKDLLASSTAKKPEILLPAPVESEISVSIATIAAVNMPRTPEKPKSRKTVRVILPVPSTRDDDSDDDLEITDNKSNARVVLDNVPTNKARDNASFRVLRHLANLTSPGRNKLKSKGAMNMNELKFSLQAKARQQALKDREDRINEARARGIYIPTTEERERDQAELISIEKAREEAMLLAKSERAEALKNGEVDENALPDSEDDDEYEGSEEEALDDISDDAADDEEDEDDDKAAVVGDKVEELRNPFLDEEADDSDGVDSDNELLAAALASPLAAVKQSVTEPEFKRPAAIHKPRNRKVVLDEDDSDDESNQNAAPFEAFDFGQENNLNGIGMAMGLSQAFAGTLADSQQPEDNEPESLAALREFLPGTIPEFDNALLSDRILQDSQGDRLVEATQSESFPQVHLGISQFETQELLDESVSKMPELSQLTQDIGFAAPREPAGVTAIHSTIDTVPLHAITQDTPKPSKRGRLRRKPSIIAVLSDSENEPLELDEEEIEEPEPTKDAFDVLFKQAKRMQRVDDFNKKKSAAKNMVEEQAEESEDEYKGLGGASDDDSDGEFDEEVAKMIDHGDVKVDERAIAAFHA